MYKMGPETAHRLNNQFYVYTIGKFSQLIQVLCYPFQLGMLPWLTQDMTGMTIGGPVISNRSHICCPFHVPPVPCHAKTLIVYYFRGNIKFHRPDISGSSGQFQPKLHRNRIKSYVISK